VAADWTDQIPVDDTPGSVTPLEVAGWPLEPHLPGSSEPEPLPLDALPEVLREFSRTISEATQAPIDSAIGVALGGVSVAIVGKALVEICPRRGWRKPVHTYVLIEQPSGTGKSPLVAFPREPIARWEMDQAKAEAPERQWREEAVRLAEDRVKAARKTAVNGKGDKDVSEGDLRACLEELAEAEAKPQGAFQLLISDATEEETVRVLAGNGGRAASVDPEGTILEVAAGRYGNGDARLAALTHGWDGEAMRVNRVTRARVDIPSANLALLLALQPGILEGMLNAETMTQRGVLARFLCISPTIRWDRIRTGRDVPSLDRAAVDRYGRMLTRILETSDRSDKSEAPHVLRMSPEAQEGVYRLEEARVAGMRPGGPLASVPAFAGKLPDHGSRIAALLTLADRADTGEDLFHDPIPGWAMEAAEALVTAIATHVVKVTGNAGGDPELADLRYLLALAVEMEGETESNIRERARARQQFRDAEHFRRIFDLLEARGCIRRVPQPRNASTGRDPSPWVEIHPALKASDLSDEPPSEDRQGNKSDKSEASPIPRMKPEPPANLWEGGPAEPEELSEEDRQYLEDERLGMMGEPVEVFP